MKKILIVAAALILILAIAFVGTARARGPWDDITKKAKEGWDKAVEIVNEVEERVVEAVTEIVEEAKEILHEPQLSKEAIPIGPDEDYDDDQQGQKTEKQSGQIIDEIIAPVVDIIDSAEEEKKKKKPFIVSGYVDSSAQHRHCRKHKFHPDDLEDAVKKLTHLNVASIRFDKEGNIKPHKRDCKKGKWAGCKCKKHYYCFYDQLRDLKDENKHLKLVASFGGWSWGHESPCKMWSKMASNATYRHNFVENVVQFVAKFEFDGIDLDWEFPGAANLGCDSYDASNYLALLEELRAEIDKDHKGKLLLTMTGPMLWSDILNVLSTPAFRLVDYINLLSMDFHGPWEDVTGINAPLYDQNEGDNLSVDSVVRQYLRAGVPPEKLILGVPAYGYTYDVSSSKKPFTIGTKSNGPGAPGPCTQEEGMLAYFEIVSDLLRRNGAGTAFDELTQCPYAWDKSGNPWVSYDDPSSIKSKMIYVKKQGLAGAMLLTLDMDDFRDGFPLLSAIHTSLNN